HLVLERLRQTGEDLLVHSRGFGVQSPQRQLRSNVEPVASPDILLLGKRQSNRFNRVSPLALLNLNVRHLDQPPGVAPREPPALPQSRNRFIVTTLSRKHRRQRVAKLR